jgi:PAS domain S-box-containing protein
MTTNLNSQFIVEPEQISGEFSHEGLLNSIPALIARLDCNLDIQYVNRSFAAWFSPFDSPLRHPFPAVVGKTIFNQVQRHLGAVLSGEQSRFTITLQHEGSTRMLDVTLTPELDHCRHVTGLIFHSTDVTEKVNDQNILRDFFDNATIGLHWVDSNGLIVWANPAELKLLGYTAEEYIGHHISEFHKSQSCIAEILDRLSNREVLKNCEAELVCKDGSTKFVTINSSVLWEGDKFIHTRCFTIDITAQKLAAQAARKSDEQFKVVANLVPLIIWTSDENGLVTFLNHKWEEITGKPVADGLGNQWLSVGHPEDRKNIETAWGKALSERKVFEAKFRMANAQGAYMVGYINAQPRFDSAGAFIGYTGIIQDISIQEQIKSSLEKMVLERTEDLRKKNIDLQIAEKSLKSKNEELEKINDELSSFAHVASHDLQEPLRKIQTLIDRVILSDGANLSPKGKEFMNRVQLASGRMRGLIQDILAYSKTNRNDGKIEPVDFNELLQDVLSEFEVKLEETNAKIQNLGLPTLHVVRFQFHQLFLNLISNALKFCKPGRSPVIQFAASVVSGNDIPDGNETGDFVHLTIRDNGIGFEAEYAERIFEIFNRLHNKREIEGTGLGLAICKKIVERHGGKMTAEGIMDEGAVFHIYLPISTNDNLF